MVDEKRLLCLLSLKNIMQSDLPCGTEPYLEKYKQWAHKMTQEFDAAENGKATLRQRLENTVNDEKLITKVQDCGLEGQLIAESCQNLGSVLSGEGEALDFLFRDDLLEKFYRYDEENSHAFERLEVYLYLMTHENSNIKVLEIGAGTGGATDRVLRGLSIRDAEDTITMPLFSEYVYTNISSAFFENAKAKFSDMASRITFTKLDITEDPTEQGFGITDFDLVIVSNVLHVTPSLATTLQHVRKLIKPGGKLVLYEMVRPDDILAGLCLGLLPGWWFSTEEDRQCSLALMEKGWDRYLRDNDFEGTSQCFKDREDDASHLFSVLISSVSHSASEASLLADNLLITTERSSSLQQEFISTLRSQLEKSGCGSSEIFDLGSLPAENLYVKRCGS